MAAYLIGTRGTPRHALYLGLIVTVTHTIGVFALGAITLALSEFIVPDDLYPWLNLASAILVVAVGVTVLRLRILDWVRGGARRLSGRPRTRSLSSRPSPRRTTGTGMGTTTAMTTATTTGTTTTTGTHHDDGHAHGHGHSHGHGPPPPRPCAGDRLARPPRRRHLGRPAPVPERARRSARRDLAAARRLRARSDRRFLAGPRSHDLGNRPRRDQGPRRLRPQELSGTGRSRATGRSARW